MALVRKGQKREGGTHSRRRREREVGTRQDDFVGIAEIAEMMEQRPQQVNTYVKEPDFPKCLADLAQGRIWDAEEVNDWIEANFEEEE